MKLVSEIETLTGLRCHSTLMELITVFRAENE